MDASVTKYSIRVDASLSIDSVVPPMDDSLMVLASFSQLASSSKSGKMVSAVLSELYLYLL